ncbi:mitochondrial ribosomal protein subunit L20-domain-containing protein [Scheffersomyces xylosifermentans]|uniref:mitochondrial ribosomal protein subunit L20-domain-containing protein n=1 Tax=Scheffersomyces xylosifermentans TaxID=1304137 RepID=UPI00315D90E2
MLRNFIRRSSTSASIPFEPVPINRYNQVRSQFNFKPKKTQGLIHNPASAIHRPSIKTPRAFLPESDPRRKLNTGPVFTKEQLQDYPIITAYKPQNERDYSVTPEIARKIIELRNEDPKTWTVTKLSKEFGLSIQKVNVFTGILDEHLKTKEVSELTDRQKKRINEKKKRVELWLRNEF